MSSLFVVTQPPSPPSEVLTRLKAPPGGIAQRSQLAAGVHAAVGVGAVFEHEQVVLAGDGVDGIHVGRQTAEVHYEDGAGLLCNVVFDERGIEVVGLRVDIDEDGTAPTCSGALAVAMNEYGGTMTSSPISTPAARTATSSAAVPLLTQRP